MASGTLNELAAYLYEGYWDDTEYYTSSWNLSDTGVAAKSGTITYSVGSNWYDANGISENHSALVRMAFNYLENITGIDFVETTLSEASSVDIAFGNQNSGAYASWDAYWNVYGESLFIDDAYINVDPNWFNSGAIVENDYVLQTFIHEILHTLGLGHQSNYNGSAVFPNDAMFDNDSWQNSIMSYFSQFDNTYIDASYSFLQTVMAADIIALNYLYGDQLFNGTLFGSGSAFLGDTVYGFNTTISSEDDLIMSSLSQYGDSNSYCIVDSGGEDTLDCSGWSNNQLIDLTVSSLSNYTPTISNIGGLNGNLTLAVGTIIENATGGSGNDEIYGNSVANILNGGTGTDTLIGGAGNDTYVTDGDETITEGLDAGTDTVQTSVTAILGAYLENLTLTGTSAINGTGNALDNTLIGNSAANTLIGGAGNDIYVTDGGDTITERESEGTDTVQTSATATLGLNVENLTLTGSLGISGTGNTLNNVITGNSAANTLNGGSGNDTLVGGSGDDIYITDGGDTITEANGSGTGTDSVQSSANATLGLNVENLTLTGSLGISGTGNTLNNILTGNNAANTLNGGTGNDTLIGGNGDDIYVTDGGDTITEGSNAGTDTVQNSATATLGLNVENLTLTGSLAINGTGNTLNNSITGNSAANTLNGSTGNDTLIGGTGDDIYVTDGGDTITEGSNAGTDTVQTSATATLGFNVENLTLTGSLAINGTGNTLNNSITGNSAANSLSSGSGNDTLIGGSGNDALNGGTAIDLLSGGSGNDTFIFNNVVESAITATTTDVITDFVKGQDKINLSGIDAFASSTANDTFIWKGVAAFSSATQGEVRYQKFDNSGSTNDYTMVWIDNDRDSGVEMAIRLTGLHNLTTSDFIL